MSFFYYASLHLTLNGKHFFCTYFRLQIIGHLNELHILYKSRAKQTKGTKALSIPQMSVLQLSYAFWKGKYYNLVFVFKYNSKKR